jgi:GTP-binding protein
VEHSEYVGRIAIGKVFAGKITEGQPVTVIDAESLHTQQKVMHIHQFHGLGRKQVSNVQASDICAPQ